MKRTGFPFTKKRAAILIGLVVVFALSLVAVPVFAQLDSNATQTLGEASGLSTLDLAILIARIIRAALMVIGIVLVILVVWAGYLYMVSQGDKEKVDKAKRIISSAIIGLVIIFLSYSAAAYILNRLLEAAGFGGETSTQAGGYSEPLSGSLGAGIIETHYPSRNATDIPRNTRIMVTFKEAIDPSSLIVEADGSAYDGDSATTDYLNTANVLVYQTADEDESGDVTDEDLVTATVSFTADHQTFVFDPVDYLGNSEYDTNYTVYLTADIVLEEDGWTDQDGWTQEIGSAAFTGSNAEGYQWKFEVSTELDLTPPQVTSVVPEESSDAYDRNITVQITFNEAMDPVAGSGTYDPGNGDTFANVETLYTDASVGGQNVTGTFAVVNNYKTIEFTTDDVCSTDPCGNTIYCLPASADIEVQAHAATLSEDVPQAETVAGLFDGLVDAAGNSLDGDADETAEGPGSPDAGGDDYEWEFSTSSSINDDVPQLEDISPSILEEEVDLDADVTLQFDLLMQSSTITSSNIQLVPDHEQEMWYINSSETLSEAECPVDDEGNAQTCTKVTTDHASFWESVEDEDIYYTYYPVITQGVKSAYQICMRPAYGPSETASSPLCATDDFPYCCNGLPSDDACTTANLGIELGE